MKQKIQANPTLMSLLKVPGAMHTQETLLLSERVEAEKRKVKRIKLITKKGLEILKPYFQEYVHGFGRVPECIVQAIFNPQAIKVVVTIDELDAIMFKIKTNDTHLEVTNSIMYETVKSMVLNLISAEFKDFGMETDFVDPVEPFGEKMTDDALNMFLESMTKCKMPGPSVVDNDRFDDRNDDRFDGGFIDTLDDLESASVTAETSPPHIVPVVGKTKITHVQTPVIDTTDQSSVLLFSKKAIDQVSDVGSSSFPIAPSFGDSKHFFPPHFKANSESIEKESTFAVVETIEDVFPRVSPKTVQEMENDSVILPPPSSPTIFLPDGNVSQDADMDRIPSSISSRRISSKSSNGNASSSSESTMRTDDDDDDDEEALNDFSINLNMQEPSLNIVIHDSATHAESENDQRPPMSSSDQEIVPETHDGEDVADEKRAQDSFPPDEVMNVDDDNCSLKSMSQNKFNFLDEELSDGTTKV